MVKGVWMVAVAVGAVQLLGCGGGGTSTSASPPTKAVISFSLISTQRLPFRITGVDIKAALPVGLTVTTGDGTSWKPITEGLMPGSSVASTVTSQFPISGSYSAPNIHVIWGDASNLNLGVGPGEIVRLTCALTPGTNVSETDRLALEQNLTFKASGIDPDPTALLNPSPLNTFLRPRVSVSYLP